MADLIRSMYEQRLSQTQRRLGLIDDETKQDDETQPPKPSDIDQGNRGGATGASAKKSGNEWLRTRYAALKGGAEPTPMAVDMDD